MQIPVLESVRLILRPYESRDFTAFATLNADPAVRRHVGRVLSKPQAAKLFDTVKARECAPGNEVWAVILCSTGAYIGHCWLTTVLNDPPQLGFLIAPEFWRQGYGTEIATTVLDYALNKARYPRIDASVDCDHVSCIKVLERVGMTRLREEQDVEGMFYIYSLRR